ncbi:MAG TPA: hypothetical protein ENK85_05145 [Saprospiraceae bacterium]|nr:hypothetical protein [Saprospiraceae bacterium]
MRFQITTLFFLLILPFGKTKAQSFSLPAKQVAMANIKATSFAPGYYGNPAQVAFSDKLNAFASIENRYLGTDIQGFAVGASYTSSSIGSFQMGVNRLGINGLFVQEWTLGYARKLAKKTAIGGNLLILNRQADHYDDFRTISFNLGTQFPLSENIQAGIFLSNPLPDRKEKPAYSFNSEFAAGIIWKITKLTTAFEISKPQQTKYLIKTAFDYRPKKPFSFLAGIQVGEKNLLPSLGMSYRLKGLELSFSSVFHSSLSTGLNFGISYSSVGM